MVNNVALRGIVFFCGYHGVGKTYTAKALSRVFGAKIVDCGPIIRSTFMTSGFTSFEDWEGYMQQTLGPKWDDKILLDTIRNSAKKGKVLFVVGNRDINTILYLSENTPHELPALVLYFMKPDAIIKRGYEMRSGLKLTEKEFEELLHKGPDNKLDSIKQYVLSHQDHCKLIFDKEYSENTIVQAKDFIARFYA